MCNTKYNNRFHKVIKTFDPKYVKIESKYTINFKYIKLAQLKKSRFRLRNYIEFIKFTKCGSLLKIFEKSTKNIHRNLLKMSALGK